MDVCLKMDLKLAVILFVPFVFGNVAAEDLEEGLPCELTDGTAGVCLKLSQCHQASEDMKNFAMPKICSLNIWDPIVCCIDCNFIEDRFYDVSVQFALKFQLDLKISDSEKAGHEIAEYKRKNMKCLEAAHIIQHFPCNKYEEFQDLDASVRCYDNPYDTENLDSTHDDKRHNHHLALIGYGDTPGYRGWPCSGSIISDHYILAAAHCTSNPTLGLVKFAAMGNLQRTDDRKDWQIYDVVQIIVHPNYEPPSKYHDIALLKTGDKIRYNLEVIPACLQRNEDMAEVATAIGWGVIGGHQHHPAEILKGVDIIKFSDGVCMEAYHKHRHLIDGYISSIHACYGDEEQINDHCESDSGGLLQMKTNMKKAKCLHTIIGVTAYGRACGLFGSAGLYTRVAAYVPWIESVTGRLS